MRLAPHFMHKTSVKEKLCGCFKKRTKKKKKKTIDFIIKLSCKQILFLYKKKNKT